jgi:heme-degrading monooxygenase HmoA
MSHLIVWQFHVRAGHEREFEELYGPRGAWASLFAKSSSYVGTQLLRDTTEPRRYLTIDTWKTVDAFATFREAHAAEYEALDRRCESLTERETKIGQWTC